MQATSRSPAREEERRGEQRGSPFGPLLHRKTTLLQRVQRHLVAHLDYGSGV